MSDDTGEEPDFDYRLTLTREILAMRDPVQGWQQAGSPYGLPVDLAADRALSDAVQHLSAAAALDPMSGLTSPPATGTHVSIDAMGRSRGQAAASQADRDSPGARRPPGRRDERSGRPRDAGLPGGAGLR